MFTQAQQWHYFNKKTRRIYDLLCSITAPAIDANILHDIRVACKHIKALVAIVNYCNKIKERVSTSKLNPLFKSAGKIRNAQVVLSFLEKYQVSCNSLYIENKSIIERDSSDFLLRTEKFRKDILMMKEEILFSHDLTLKHILDYYITEEKKLKFIISLPEDIILLHEARKIIKTMLLPLPFLPSKIQNSLLFDIQSFDSIQQKIGDLHDEIITIELIKKNECDSGFETGITDNNILLLYGSVRDGLSVNLKPDFGHSSSS